MQNEAQESKEMSRKERQQETLQRKQAEKRVRNMDYEGRKQQESKQGMKKERQQTTLQIKYAEKKVRNIDKNLSK